MMAADEILSSVLALANEPLLGRLLVAAVEMTVLAALVWLAIRVRLVRPARWQSLLWLVVLVKPFMVVALGPLVPIARFEVPPPPPTQTALPSTPAPVAPTHQAAAPPIVAPAGQHSDAVSSAAARTNPLPSERRVWHPQQTLVWFWAACVFCFTIHMALDRWRLFRLVRRAQPPSAELAARYADLADALQTARRPSLRVTDALESPALAGTIRPTILLPAWLAEGPWGARLDWSLRHELTHWQLGDPWANLARQIAQVFFFFNPVTWWAGRRWQEAAELACDRAVVHSERDVEDYADNLYRVLAQIHGRRRGHLAGGLFATRTQIGRRIAMLLSNPLRYPARLGTRGAVLLACLAVTILCLGIAVTPLAKADEQTADAAEGPSSDRFCVFGVITDEEAQPLPGVRVTAHCGLGTLLPTGEALSGQDGRYKLCFGPGIRHKDEQGWSVGLQAATIRAHMPGRYEKDLCMRGGLRMAEEVPPEGTSRLTRTDTVVLPEEPYRLDFVMLPAARVRVRLLDGADEPIADYRLVVSGPEVGPSASALTVLTTDAAGEAQFDAPCRPFWFELSPDDGKTVRSNTVDFAIPGSYQLTFSSGPEDANPQQLRVTVDAAPSQEGNAAPRPVPKRKWGPEQATGAPDTQGPGDIVTAWASLTPDDQPEWLLLEYSEAVHARSVRVHETFNPGALVRVSVVSDDGTEEIAWEGADPTRPGQETGVSEISLSVDEPVRRVKLHLDSPAVRGWNEIDAVGLVDASGEIHWASGATASSTYAEKRSRVSASAADAESTPVREEPEARASIPSDAVLFTYTDNTSEGIKSLGASGHAVRFERGDHHFLEAVQIAASRYGTPTPPREDFRLYVLNKDFQILADQPYPYAMVERGDLRWYTLRTPSIEVPEMFYVALAFNPHRTKGIYLAYDESVETSHAYQGLPESGYEPVEEPYDWMVRLFLSEEPSGEEGVKLLADWSPPKHVDPFEGLKEVKYDDGVSDGMQSYGGAGPYIRFPDTAWAVYRTARLLTGRDALLGLRVYGSRYGSGYDPDTTMLHLIIQDQDGDTLAKADFPYGLFSYKAKWVDLPLPEPVKLNDVDEFVCLFDPEAHQTKGIYFHYNADPSESHSGVARDGQTQKPTPDREWMIRAYIEP